MWQETWTVSNSEFTSSRLKTWESLIAPSNSVIFLLKLFNIRLQKGKTGHFDTKSFWHQLKRWNPPKNFVHESVVCAEQEYILDKFSSFFKSRTWNYLQLNWKNLYLNGLYRNDYVSKQLCIEMILYLIDMYRKDLYRTTCIEDLYHNDFVSNQLRFGAKGSIGY